VKAAPVTGVPAFDSGWSAEISLDVEWAHAIAPAATILLIEARSASLSALMSGVDFAVTQGAKQVSMSWGTPSFVSQWMYDTHFNHPGVTFLASAGDSGTGASYPSSSPYVTSIGGTSLQINTSSNRIAEATWTYGGGGAASNVSRPVYQNGFLSGTNRGTPDVAYNSDPNTGYYVYDSSSGGAWWQVGGTSAAAPQWAGLIALANQGRAALHKPSLGTGLSLGTNQVLYQLAGGSRYMNTRGDYTDITTGSNGIAASSGYDMATGLGSPVANKLVPDLINA
jgi:subtilase family serine protease